MGELKITTVDKSMSVFYEGEVMPISRAGGILIRKMICGEFRDKCLKKGIDPFKELSIALRKSEKTIRAWTHPWNTTSGASPTLCDFFRLISITGKKDLLVFLESIDSQKIPEEEAKRYGKTLKLIAQQVHELARSIDRISDSYEKEKQT